MLRLLILVALIVGSLRAQGVVFISTASATVGNSVAETTILSTGTGNLTLPANWFAPGKTLVLYVGGIHSATGNPTVQIRVKLGSVTVLDSGAVTSHTSTDESFEMRGQITCRTTGAMGTVFSQGYYAELHPSGPIVGMPNTTTNTIDTTAAQAINVTIQWGTADPGNTLTQTNVTVSVAQVGNLVGGGGK